ncbi:MAG TPA: TPM domain-containing protein [Candidatus Xenobia bacterium]|jgi:uncharacterized membrane protein YgcG
MGSRLLMALLILGCLRSAAADQTHTWDDAHKFSPQALMEFNQRAEALEKSLHKQVYLITVPSTHDKDWQAVVAQYLGGPLKNGVVIFIDMDARVTYLAVDRLTEDQVDFDVPRQSELRQMLAARFHQNDWDGGLLAGMTFVEKALASPPASASEEGSPVPVPPEPAMATAPALTCFQWFLILSVCWAGWTIFRSVFMPPRMPPPAASETGNVPPEPAVVPPEPAAVPDAPPS